MIATKEESVLWGEIPPSSQSQVENRLTVVIPTKEESVLWGQIPPSSQSQVENRLTVVIPTKEESVLWGEIPPWYATFSCDVKASLGQIRQAAIFAYTYLRGNNLFEPKNDFN